MAPSANHWRNLADFLLAYLLVLATPGPNMLLVGAAAPEGGAGLGGGAAGRLLGAALLLWVEVSVARRPPLDARRLGRGGRAAGFAAGFCTAATNPVSAAFFAAQFLGPLGAGADGGSAAVLAPLAIAAVVLAGLHVGRRRAPGPPGLPPRRLGVAAPGPARRGGRARLHGAVLRRRGAPLAAGQPSRGAIDDAGQTANDGLPFTWTSRAGTRSPFPGRASRSRGRRQTGGGLRALQQPGRA